MGWVDLCRLGAQNRHASSAQHELLQYLRGWCRVADHDMDGALAQLAPLMASVTPGFATAVRIDLAECARRLRGRSRRGALDREAPHRRRAAVRRARRDLRRGRTTRRREADQRPHPGDRSRRRRDAVPAADPTTAPRFRTATTHRSWRSSTRSHSGTIRPAFGSTTCWRAGPSRSRAAPRTSPMRTWTKESRLLIANYAAWPQRAQPQQRWSTLADAFISVRGVDGADVLAVTALEAALRTTGCVATTSRAEIRRRAEVLRRDASHDPTLDPRLDALINHAADHCLKP